MAKLSKEETAERNARMEKEIAAKLKSGDMNSARIHKEMLERWKWEEKHPILAVGKTIAILVVAFFLLGIVTMLPEILVYLVSGEHVRFCSVLRDPGCW
jgi:hypothetical protein